MLKEHGYNTSLCTILRCWTSLGWTFQGSKYRQLIRTLKRFELAWPYITESFEPSAVSAMSHGLTSHPCNCKAINSALKSSVPTAEAQSLSIFFTPRGVCRKYSRSILRNMVNWVRSTNVEGKIYSRTDIISDRRLQRSKHGSNCARWSEQQDMLALG